MTVRASWFVAAAALLLGGGGLGVWAAQGPDVPARILTGLVGDAERGAYVARLGGCIACHTDAKAGGAMLAGGAGLATPFGTFHAPNITPHPTDGIGGWTLDQFARAMTGGVAPDGGHYFPSFPYTHYTRLSDQDLVDLWVGLRAVPAVAGRAPDHALTFPFGYRAGAAVWQRLFFEPGQMDPVPGRSPRFERGRYLAEGPGHCGACHTPRNLLGGQSEDARFQGGTAAGTERVPAITRLALEAEDWTLDDVAYALQTGIKPDGDVLGGSMAEVIRDATQYWTSADREAVAAYLFAVD